MSDDTKKPDTGVPLKRLVSRVPWSAAEDEELSINYQHGNGSFVPFSFAARMLNERYHNRADVRSAQSCRRRQLKLLTGTANEVAERTALEKLRKKNN